MKNFQILNSTKLLFRNSLIEDLTTLTRNKKVMFVYGGGSVHRNGCYDDVKTSVHNSGGHFYEFGSASREITDIERGIHFSRLNRIELLIGAGGGSVMDATKIISFGHCNSNFYDLIKSEQSITEMAHLPFILIPTYPSSGSENIGSAAITELGNFHFAYGISSDYSFLVPKYSLTLNRELTSYSCLTTIVQLSMVVFGDKNHLSYDFGISVIKNVLKAAKNLNDNPTDLKARGVVLYAASISTSELIGIEKEIDYSSDFYFLEIMIEPLFNTSYRKALTSLFPAYLKYTAKNHDNEVKKFLSDAFDLNGNIDDSINELIHFFTELGIDLYFNENYSDEKLSQIKNNSSLQDSEIREILNDLIKINS